jgi:hypothetical protein
MKNKRAPTKHEVNSRLNRRSERPKTDALPFLELTVRPENYMLPGLLEIFKKPARYWYECFRIPHSGNDGVIKFRFVEWFQNNVWTEPEFAGAYLDYFLADQSVLDYGKFCKDALLAGRYDDRENNRRAYEITVLPETIEFIAARVQINSLPKLIEAEREAHRLSDLMSRHGRLIVN